VILADASSAFLGQWILVAATVITLLVGLGTIASYFATRGEVTDLKLRMQNMDALVEKVRADGSQRGKDLHNRIDPLELGMGRIEGQLSAFNLTFEKFTRIIESTSHARDEQIRAFTSALETFASIIANQNRERDRR